MPAAADRTIVLAGGGTGGSVSPLLALATSLRELAPHVRCVFIGTQHGPEERLVPAAGLTLRTIPAGKLRRYWSWQNLADVVRVAAGTRAALRLLGELRAVGVVSAGGFVAVPVVWAAWLRRIPVLIHQQDLTVGLANRLSAPFARRITAAFPESSRAFGRRPVTVTGNPVRRELMAGSSDRARSTFNLEASRPTVLCVGGGTGASGLNALFVEAIRPLLNDIQVLHLTGAGRAVPPPSAPSYHAFSFLTEALPDAYAVADVVVSRAGLGTLSELAALGKATVVVPMPASHQTANADYFAAAGAVLSVAQAAGPAALRTAVQRLLADPTWRDRLGRAGQRVVPRQSADRLARVVLELLS